MKNLIKMAIIALTLIVSIGCSKDEESFVIDTIDLRNVYYEELPDGNFYITARFDLTVDSQLNKHDGCTVMLNGWEIDGYSMGYVTGSNGLSSAYIEYTTKPTDLNVEHPPFNIMIQFKMAYL